MELALFADFGISLAVGLITAAAGAALSAAAKPKLPEQQGYGEINAGAIRADADTLAVRRELEAAGRLGIKSDVPTGGYDPVTETRRFVTVPASDLTPAGRARIGITNQTGPVEVPYVEAEWAPGGIYNRSGNVPKPEIYEKQVVTGYQPRTGTVDFTGQGDADIQAKVAEQMAPMLLELEKQFGPEFIAQAKAMQEQADPDGTEARKMLAGLINEEATNVPDRPLARTLDAQVNEFLAADGGLTADESGMVDNLLAGRVNDTAELEAIKQSLVAGEMGQRRRSGAQQTATGWLASGATPEDVEYRRRQQSMGNRANFLAGKTPTAQFGQLSAAKTGAAPVVFGQPLANVNPDATGAFAQTAASQYGTQAQFNSQQANPWFAGLSTAIRGVGGVMAAQRR